MLEKIDQIYKEKAEQTGQRRVKEEQRLEELQRAKTRREKKLKEEQEAREKIGLSIIIANYKQEKELNNLLKNIFSLKTDYKGEFEVIVVSDGFEISIKEEFFNYNLKHFHKEKNLGSGQARHFGVLKSSYDLVLFIDSDINFNCDFLSIINNKLRSENLDGVIGVVDGKPINNNSLNARYMAAETNYYGSVCKKIDHNFFIGLCGAIKKNTYLNNIGFYHHIIDDMEFSSRLDSKTKIQTLKDIKFSHKYSSFFKNLKKLFFRSYYFSQLDKKPFSPWFSKVRKISTISSVFSLAFFSLALFEPIFYSLFFLFGLIFLISCLELQKFKSKLIDKFLFIPLKFFSQLAIGMGYGFGLIKFNLKLFSEFIIYKSGPFRIYFKYNKPTYLILYVTGKCNSKCSYCFQWDILNIKERIRKELTLNEYILFAKKLGSIEHLTLGGGEPTLRKDLSDIAIAFYKYSKVRNISFPSNGIRPDLLEKHVEKILKNCPKLILKVSISIDGVEKEHDKLRGVLGNYDRVIESDKVLRGLRKKFKNLYYIINTCFLGQNENNVLATIKKNEENFDHDIQVSTFVRGSLADADYSKKVDINKYFELVDYLENIQRIEKKTKSYTLDFLHQGLQIECRSTVRHIMETGKGKYSCTAGKNMLVMDELGNINPCEILPSKFSYGNIRNFNMDVNELWKHQKIKNIQKRIKNEKCFCTWECAQLNSIVFSPKGILNMFKQASKISKRKKKMLQIGENISFEEYKKHFQKKIKPITDMDKYVHPMVNEGNNLNPFNIKNEISDKNEIIPKDGMNKEELEYKKQKWLKPVKAGTIPETYKYK